jgi:hypothetical protein
MAASGDSVAGMVGNQYMASAHMAALADVKTVLNGAGIFYTTPAYMGAAVGVSVRAYGGMFANDAFMAGAGNQGVIGGGGVMHAGAALMSSAVAVRIMCAGLMHTKDAHMGARATGEIPVFGSIVGRVAKQQQNRVDAIGQCRPANIQKINRRNPNCC